MSDPLFSSVFIWIIVVASGLAIISPITHLWHRYGMGHVLFRLGRSRWWNKLRTVMTVLNVIALLLLGIGMLMSREWHVFALLLLPMTLGCLNMWLEGSGFVIRPGGLCYRSNDLRWERLTSYQWKGTDTYKLGLNAKGDGFVNWVECITVTPDEKDKADAVLAQYLPYVDLP